MDLKYITGGVKAAHSGGFDAVITTPRLDTDMESVYPLGLKNRDEYMSNPLVYWAHEWAFDPSAEPIGKATRLDVFADRIESAAEYAPTAKAQNVRALVSGGFVRKTSIGFDSLLIEPIKGIPTHTSWALREYSVVPMPANTEATITGVKSALSWLAEQMPAEGDSDRVVVKLDAADLIAALTKADLTLGTVPGESAVVVRDSLRVIARISRRRMVRRLS